MTSENVIPLCASQVTADLNPPPSVVESSSASASRILHHCVIWNNCPRRILIKRDPAVTMHLSTRSVCQFVSNDFCGLGPNIKMGTHTWDSSLHAATALANRVHSCVAGKGHGSVRVKIKRGKLNCKSTQKAFINTGSGTWKSLSHATTALANVQSCVAGKGHQWSRQWWKSKEEDRT